MVEEAAEFRTIEVGCARRSSSHRRRTRTAGRQFVASENPLLDRLPFDEVLLYEPRNLVGGHAVIPRPFGVDEHRRPLAADAQAADLGAVAGPFATAQVLVLDLVLERFPRLQAVFGRAAVGAGAEQDVAP